jgi:hypothetical protein
MSESEIPFNASSSTSSPFGAGLARCVEALLAGAERLKASYESKIASDAEVGPTSDIMLPVELQIISSICFEYGC